MILLLSALILTSPRTQPPAPEIAYGARFYAEGKKQSYYHVYISRADGTHKRQVTFGKRSHIGVVWVDRTHLAWSEFAGPVTLAMSPSTLRTVSFVVLDMVTGRKKVVGSNQAKGPIADVLPENQEFCFGEVVGRYSHYTSFKVTKNRIIKGQNYKDWAGMGERIFPDKEDSKLRATLNVPGSNVPYTATFGPREEDQKESFEVTIDRKGIAKKFTLPGDDIKSMALNQDGSLFVTSGYWFNKFDNNQDLTQIGFAKSQMKTVLQGFGEITLASDHTNWAGRQSQSRPLAKIKLLGKPLDHQVWVNYLYAGNWKTGKHFAIADGLVEVNSFQFRPNK